MMRFHNRNHSTSKRHLGCLGPSGWCWWLCEAWKQEGKRVVLKGTLRQFALKITSLNKLYFFNIVLYYPTLPLCIFKLATILVRVLAVWRSFSGGFRWELYFGLAEFLLALFNIKYTVLGGMNYLVMCSTCRYALSLGIVWERPLQVFLLRLLLYSIINCNFDFL